MRSAHLVALTLLGWALPLRVYGLPNTDVLRRQDTATASYPSLTTDGFQAASGISTSTSDSTASTDDPNTSDRGVAEATSSSPEPTATPSKVMATSIVPATSPPNAQPTATASAEKYQDELPLEPTITPAFGAAGVLLIIIGTGYALVGVKDRWVQIFLSSGFLASIATTALVTYVMDPPVKDAIQGGYFVAIVMTGVIFGAGALVFKEFTEGLGCLLGGFCLSMWLLTLRSGGLVRSSFGKGVFIGVLCLCGWTLSWTRYTRPYGLIASTSFSGATAFMLGIDCFTKSGMKEFWVYLWDLNDDLFPSNITTYPQTRGIRVEIAIVIIGTFIGLLSQIKLWKVIRSKHKEKEVLHREGELQNEATEAALGRQLLRQNEREKSEWEWRYGGRILGNRNTILWQGAHPEKQYSQVSVVAAAPGPPSPSGSLEMQVMESNRTSLSFGPTGKSPSLVRVGIVEEVLEERTKTLKTLEECEPGEAQNPRRGYDADVQVIKDREVDQHASVHTESEGADDPLSTERSTHFTISGPSQPLSPTRGISSESRETLLGAGRPYSRASSAAATLDTDNEELNVSMLEAGMEEGRCTPGTPPDMVMSPATPHWQGALVSGSGRAAASLSGDGGGTISESGTKTSDGGDKSPPHSQSLESTSSSVESLTQTALAQVPSQLSNVMLSYRTNEWAKHVATADVPMYDELEMTRSVEGEPPIRLAISQTEAEHILLPRDPNVEMPAAGLATEPVKAGSAGVGIAASPTAKRRSLPDQARSRGGPPVSLRSGSVPFLRASGNRSSRNLFHLDFKNSLVTTSIDENTATVFPHPSLSGRRAFEGSPYLTSSQRRSSAPLPSSSRVRPYKPHGVIDPQEAANHQSLQVNRPGSQHQGNPGSGMDTRLDSYDSRQPARPENRNDDERRKSLLAEWRLSQQYRATSNGLGGASADAGRAQMRAKQESQKLKEEYQRAAQREKQYAMDQAMRRPDMQELHREAMRKMQASVNNRLRSASS